MPRTCKDGEGEDVLLPATSSVPQVAHTVAPTQQRMCFNVKHVRGPPDTDATAWAQSYKYTFICWAYSVPGWFRLLQDGAPVLVPDTPADAGAWVLA